MPVIDLYVMLPPDQVELVDYWDQSQSERAGKLLVAIESNRAAIRDRALCCLACDLPVIEARCITHCAAMKDDSALIRRSVICASCTADLSRERMYAIAASSLAESFGSEVIALRGPGSATYIAEGGHA